jgi:HD-GYP domain-containing protein (c-di-GMP phosphodiesterase class II)/DNA-binding LacI/PurR family transcriptional regulator
MSANGRPTIGFFVDWLDDTYQQAITKGILNRAEKRDTNILVFDGGSIQSTRTYETLRNVIYDRAGTRNLDGLIVLAGSIGHFTTREEVRQFCKRFHPLPVVSITYEMEGIPAVFVDNAEGMRQLVLHFAKHHGARKIAYIDGPEHNQDAQERLAAYTAALEECGLENRDAIRVRGDFTYQSGASAAASLLWDSGTKFDAIIAANDTMALGAMRALQQMGLRVPQDMPIGGFDNDELSLHSHPSLTTVNQPFVKQGSRAMDLVLALIDGGSVPPKTVLPSTLIVRESCGCFSPEVQDIDGDSDSAAHPMRERMEAERFMQSFAAYLEGEKSNNSMLQLWDELDGSLPWPEDYLATAQQFVSSIMRETEARTDSSPEKRRKADRFFHQLRALVAQEATVREKKSFSAMVRQFWALHNLTEVLLDAQEENDVTQVLYDLLPSVKIGTCFISRPGPEPETAVPFFALRNGRPVPLSSLPRVFPEKALLPDGFLPGDTRVAMIVETLCHLDHIGVAFFEVGPENCRLYGELRRAISVRLQGVFLFGQLKAQSQTLVELRRVMGGMIQTLAMTVETRDPYTAGHQKRVADLARTIATRLGLAKDVIEGVRLAAIVHDLGKITVPSEILNKSGKLMREEFELIKLHPQAAHDILKTVDFPWPIADIVHQHHERMNGSGYPRGLSGDSITMEARILAVADVAEAMASRRPYREAVGIEEAMKEIRKGRGILYDADAADACLDLFESKGYRFK